MESGEAEGGFMELVVGKCSKEVLGFVYFWACVDVVTGLVVLVCLEKYRV